LKVLEYVGGPRNVLEYVSLDLGKFYCIMWSAFH